MILWYPLGKIKTLASSLITCPIWNPQSFRLVAVYLTACPQNNWYCLNIFFSLVFSITAKNDMVIVPKVHNEIWPRRIICYFYFIPLVSFLLKFCKMRNILFHPVSSSVLNLKVLPLEMHTSLHSNQYAYVWLGGVYYFLQVNDILEPLKSMHQIVHYSQ